MNQPPQIRRIDQGIHILAPAKINISLLIAGKRPDGFHEIETVMAKVSYFDEIDIHLGQKAGIQLTCQGPHWAPEGRDNLVYQAANLLFDYCHIRPHIKITLKKNIPAGTGLGSASSDAAAILIALNDLFGLALSRDTLAGLGAQLGSDVPFFVYGPLSLCKGRGERVQELDVPFNFTALLVLPDIKVSTKMVYDNYLHDQREYELLSQQINGQIKKNNVDFIAKMCANMLAFSCFGLNRELSELKERIESGSIGPLCLSGSGSALYCIIEREHHSHIGSCLHKIEQEMNCVCLSVRNVKW